MRIGHGYDVHRFAEPSADAAVMLGGVAVPFERGVLAHSDGDVVIHALCDALLGALALGDIGKWFPDTDATWQGADSRDLLRRVNQAVQERAWQLCNADITVIAERPRLAPHVDAMREHLAADLGVATNQISVKATTTERLGYLGRGEGLAAEAVVLLAPVT